MKSLKLKHVRWLIAAGLVLALACSRGELSDSHDRYMNIFGLPLVDAVPNKGAFLGRALLTDGGPAAWAQVDARHSGDEAQAYPLVTMTNEKGGFFLANLEPGSYDVYVRSPAGQATRYQAQVAGGDVVVVEEINLLPTARVSGHATLANQPVHTGIVVNVPGTPFATFTDHEGAYYLDLPVGTYAFRADKDAYQPSETEAQAISTDTTLDFSLEENPWPNGKVTAITEDGYIVRGLTTTIILEPVEGVRYFRLSQYENSADVNANRTWQPLVKQLELKMKGEGASSVDVEFMDQYGKMSDRVSAKFYNTERDQSWEFLHGLLEGPVTIKAGRKVAFLGSGQGYGGYPIETVLNGSGDSIAVGSASGSSGPPSAPRNMTMFRGHVTIEAGVEITGGATFGGGLTVLGIKDQPVVWSGIERLYSNETVLVAREVDLRYLMWKGLTFTTLGARVAVRISDSSFTNSHIDLEQGFNSAEAAASSMRIDHTALKDSIVESSCWHSRSGFDGSGTEDTGSGSGPGSDSRYPPNGTMELAIENSSLDDVQLRFRCVNFSADFTTKVVYRHNNAFGLTDDSYYVSGTLPVPEKQAYDVTENYYQSPDRLNGKLGAGEWPAFFGTKSEAPLTEVGIR